MHAYSTAGKLRWSIALLSLILLGYFLVKISSASPAIPYSAAQPPAPGVFCSTITFASPVTYTASTRPRSSTTALLNSDNNLDLVVTDYSANAVSVFLGNSDGTFQPAVNYAVGVHPVSVAVADFNEDNKNDLVISNYDSSNVTILPGNGDGTFQAGTGYSSNIGPYGVTVGDFNENNHVDVATSNVNFATINVMLGNGDGSLQSPVSYAAGLRPQVIAAGRFNADNHLDLVVPNYTASTVSVFLGNGNGTFQPASPYTMTAFPDYLTVADLNDDLKLDLILSHYNTTNNIGVALGNGDGTFSTEVTYTTGGNNPTFASVGDFNGDGIPDLASPGYASDNVSILVGNGKGTFQSPVSFTLPSGSSPVSVLPGDFNHDGRMDMFTANENTNDIAVFLNTCSAATGTPAATSTPTTAPTSTNTPSPTSPLSQTPTLTPTPTLTSTPIQPTSTPSICPITWSLVSSPNIAEENVLNSVAVVDANDIWAVGIGGSMIGQTLIEHWDGASWSIVTSPNLGHYGSFLNAVTAISVNDVWAVGYHFGAQYVAETLTMHWDGALWTIVSSPNLPASYNYLKSVTAISTNDVWAVGYTDNDDSGNETLAMHWNGTAWTITPTPNADSGTNRLTGVDAVSANDVWAVGYYRFGAGIIGQTLIEHWDGSAWSIVTSPNIGIADNYLTSVSAISTNDIWAVGYYYLVDDNYGFKTLVLHWDGTEWSIVTSPNPSLTNNELTSVSAISTNDVWAVGFLSEDGAKTLTVHWDGSSWLTISSPNGSPADNFLKSVASVSANNVWAVGQYVSRTMIERYADSCTLPTATPTPTACPIQFADVPQGSTFYSYIRCLACRGIVSGYTTDPPCTTGTPCFLPGNNVTRGQMAKFIANAANYTDPIPPSQQTFTDVPPGSTFWLYIERVYLHDVVSGYTTNPPCTTGTPCFLPGNNVTRGQAAKFVSISSNYTDPIPPSQQSFTDVPPMSTFWEVIERVYQHNIISGYTTAPPCTTGTPCFLPANNVTRGQTAKLISNAFYPDCDTP